MADLDLDAIEARYTSLDIPLIPASRNIERLAALGEHAMVDVPNLVGALRVEREEFAAAARALLWAWADEWDDDPNNLLPGVSEPHRSRLRAILAARAASGEGE